MQRSSSRFKVTQQEALLTKGKSDWATNKMDGSTLINYKLKSKYAQPRKLSNSIYLERYTQKKIQLIEETLKVENPEKVVNLPNNFFTTSFNRESRYSNITSES